MYDNSPHNEIATDDFMLSGNGFMPIADEYGYYSIRVTKRAGDNDQSLKAKAAKFIALMGVRRETAHLWPNVPVTLVADTPTHREFREAFMPTTAPLSAA